MEINEARYIVRMINTLATNILFLDATDDDSEEIDKMKERYNEAGGWTAGSETARAEFIMRVSKNGVRGGKLLHKGSELDRLLKQRGIPRIERPSPV